jgi:predicted O-methyltransferase YrrM
MKTEYTHTRQVLAALLSDPPLIHRGETEVEGPLRSELSSLRPTAINALAANGSVCWGIDVRLAEFLFSTLGEGAMTLETGAGVSTLVFALKRTQHVAISPHASEFAALRRYARDHGISLQTTKCVVARSEDYLPSFNGRDLDLVLIDGKHAFPWPVIDWFYTADKLRRGGICVFDDIDLRAVRMLCDFLRSDRGWQTLFFDNRTAAFEKLSDNVRNVAWHYQHMT